MTRSNYSDALISPVGVPNYLVATPYWGAIDVAHLDCVMALRRLYPEMIKQSYHVRGCAYIDVARATAAQAAIDGGNSGLFFIDHDVIFDPRDVVAMMREAEREQTIVYGLYSMRRSGDRMIGLPHPSVEQLTCFEGGGLYPGFDGGLGFAAIPRAVLEAVGKDMQLLETGFSKVKPLFALRSGLPDWPVLFERLEREGLLTLEGEIGREEFAAIVREEFEGAYAGEDISFFARARRAGFAPLVDTRPRLWHHGAYRYGLEDVQVCVPRADSLIVTLDRTPKAEQELTAAE